MKKKDIILIGVVLLVAFAGYIGMKAFQRDGKTVVVTVDGKTVFSESINNDQEYKIPEEDGINVIRIKDKKVTMIDADCPDKICKNHKAISKSGETIVCLPHKIVVEVKASQDDSESDGIVG